VFSEVRLFNEAAIRDLRRSASCCRVYVGRDEIRRVQAVSVLIMTTPKGVCAARLAAKALAARFSAKSGNCGLRFWI
jgi:ribosomal protein S8